MEGDPRGLVTSTFLNMVLVPVLFLRHGGDPSGGTGPA
jgi:hypothetical protein